MSPTAEATPESDLPGPRERLARAAFVGIGTAVVVPRVPPRVRRGRHLGLALAAALGLYAGAPDLRVSPSQRAALAAGLALLAGGSSALGSAADAAAERALVRRGVRHPRWWIGLGAVALVEASELGRRVWGRVP